MASSVWLPPAGTARELFMAKVWYLLWSGALVFYQPYVPLYLKTSPATGGLGWEPWLVGLLQGLRLWVYVPCSLILCAMADRLNIHRALMVGCFCSSVVLRAAIGLVPGSFPSVAATLLLADALSAPVSVIADAAVVSKCQRDGEYGRYRVYASFGWGGLAVAAGAVIARYGPRWGMLVYVCLSAPAAVAAWALNPGAQRGEAVAAYVGGGVEGSSRAGGQACKLADKAKAAGKARLSRATSAHSAAPADVLAGPDTAETSIHPCAAEEPFLIRAHYGSDGFGAAANVGGAGNGPDATGGISNGGFSGPASPPLTRAASGPRATAALGLVEPLPPPLPCDPTPIVAPSLAAEGGLPPVCECAALAAAAANGPTVGAPTMQEIEVALAAAVAAVPPFEARGDSARDLPGLAPTCKLLDCPVAEEHAQMQPLKQLPLQPPTAGGTCTCGSQAAVQEAPDAAGGGVRGLLLLLRQPRVLVFLLRALVTGYGVGHCTAFVFLLVKEMGGSEVLMGLCIVFQMITEVPAFQFQAQLLARAPVQLVFNGSMVLLSVRLAAYWLLRITAHSAWLVLLIELLHGVTFGTAWGAGIISCKRIAPAALNTTMQSVFAALFSGVGPGIGGIVGGALMQRYGTGTMFWTAGAVVAAGLVLSCILDRAIVYAEQQALRKPSTTSAAAGAASCPSPMAAAAAFRAAPWRVAWRRRRTAEASMAAGGGAASAALLPLGPGACTSEPAAGVRPEMPLPCSTQSLPSTGGA